MWIIGGKFPVVLAVTLKVSVSFIVPILSDIDSGSVGRYN